MLWKWLHFVFAPGFFSSQQVENALLMGTMVAIVSGFVGIFVVIRGQSYLGHALGDFGATGASMAFLMGIAALWGFFGAGFLAGTGINALEQRSRGRDVATGVIHAFVMGLGALFLYLDTTYTNLTGAPMTILFGSIFLVDPSMVPITILFGILTLALLVFLYRPLLLSTLNENLAKTRGVPVRLVGFLFTSCMAMAVAQSSLIVGALLSTALLIGPAATAIRFTKRTNLAIFLAMVLGVASIWLGILLAYDSYNWPPTGRGWPVSFFVTTFVLIFYLLSRVPVHRSQHHIKKEPARQRERAEQEVVTHAYPMEQDF